MSLMNHYKNGNEAVRRVEQRGLVGDPTVLGEGGENKDGDDAAAAVFDKWLNTPWGRRLVGGGRLAVLVALLQRQDVVGGAAPAQRAVRALR